MRYFAEALHTGGGAVSRTDLAVLGTQDGEPGILKLEVVVEVVDPLPEGVVEIRNIVVRPGEPDPECPSPACVLNDAQQPVLTLLKDTNYAEASIGYAYRPVGNTG